MNRKFQRKEFTIRDYLKNKSLVKDPTIRQLSGSYLLKAKSNLITTSVLFNLNLNSEARKLLEIPENYNSDEWVVVSSYYAMYAAALALLTKIGYKSSSHTATILALEKFFVNKELIGQEYLAMLKHAQLTQNEVQELASAKNNREIAQYSVTKATTHALSEASRKNAYEFVNKVESILRS
jgi:uncharacterized protein (UPF0332 family)